MCGIVGYAGSAQAAPILLAGLERLEYRGYDSAGICVHGENGLAVKKTKGRLAVLRELTGDGSKLPGTVGIGHTRWATHGAPSERNSHPHFSFSGKIAVVHNGIIENEAALRQKLERQGVIFQSETDTEVVACLIGEAYERTADLRKAVRKTVEVLRGSFALGILCQDLPGTVIAVKKDSPLIFGFGDGENLIASDVTAVLPHTEKVVFLEDGETVVFSKTEAVFYDAAGDRVEKSWQRIPWTSTASDRDGFGHYMLKEIFEQPQAVKATLAAARDDVGAVLGNLKLSGEELQKLRRILLVACGSAYYAAAVGKYTLERMCAIPTEISMASEFRYGDPAADTRDLVILISQSGETADTLAALREAKRLGCRTLAIVNVPGSAIAREADGVLYTHAGPEIAVATTKAFSAQLVTLECLALHMASKLKSASKEAICRGYAALEALPDRLRMLLDTETMTQLQYLADRYCGRHNAFYVGRNTDSCICMEGSLKLKEVAYLHSEAYPAGELKHGPISMIEEGTLVVALATVDRLFEKMMANLCEVKARGASVICVTTPRHKALAAAAADHVIIVPEAEELVLPNLAVVPLQLFAYYVAVNRGCDVDKPRNLAKSVTVE